MSGDLATPLLDQIENGVAAVEINGNHVVTMPIDVLPKGVTEGDVLRVTLEVRASTDMTWVVLSDPIPGGATLLGSGLGRDSAIAAQASDAAEQPAAWPSFVERGFDSYRAYYEYLPQGKSLVEYTVRLNTPGQFQLPPTRVEAMYQPDVFGVLPNNRPLDVQAGADDAR